MNKESGNFVDNYFMNNDISVYWSPFDESIIKYCNEFDIFKDFDFINKSFIYSKI
jgi:hypothetical protein